MTPRRILVQFGMLSASRILAAILQGISLILVARAIQPSEFGLLAAVLGLALVAQTFFDAGLSTYILRQRSSFPKSGLVTSALRLNDRLSVALCLSVAIVMVLLGVTWQAELLLLAPLAVWMSAERNGEAWLGVAFADGDSRYNFLNLVIRRLLALVVFFLLQQTSLPALLAFSLAWASTSYLASLVAKKHVRSGLPEAEPVSFIGLVRETWPFWIHSMSSQGNNLDVTIAALVGGPYQAGIFATATRLISPLRILPTSMAKAILPAASRASTRSSKRLLLGYCLIMVFAMSMIYAALFVLTPRFLPVVLGEQYRSASSVLQIVLLGLPLAATASLLGSVLQGAGEKRFVANASLVATGSYLVSIVIGMNSMGASGAATALCVSYVLQSSALVYKVIQTLGRTDPDFRPDTFSESGVVQV